MKIIALLERLFRSFIEEPGKRIWQRELTVDVLLAEIQQHIGEAVRRGIKVESVRLKLHPDTLSKFNEKHTDLPAFLHHKLRQNMQNAGIPAPFQTPKINILADKTTSTQQAIITIKEMPAADTTQIHQMQNAGNEVQNAISQLDAFLVVNGRQHHLLDHPTLTIGRELNNDLRLESLKVSRHHAQIRYRFGRFVIYDLSSRAGITINGKQLSETVLSPGDVISLADQTLIYSEGYQQTVQMPATSKNINQTQTMPLNR